jgi:DNA-binding transcriptional MerR regulator
MVNLDDINTKELIEYLNKLGFDQERISEILKDDDPEYAEFRKAFFLMLCYNKQAVIQPMKSGWMQRTADAYQNKPDRDDGEILELWDESDAESYAKSLENLANLGVKEQDLHNIIRQNQRNTLANVMQALDGTFGGDFGLFETEYVDDESIPKRRIFGLQDDFLDYDPNTKKPDR